MRDTQADSVACIDLWFNLQYQTDIFTGNRLGGVDDWTDSSPARGTECGWSWYSSRNIGRKLAGDKGDFLGDTNLGFFIIQCQKIWRGQDIGFTVCAQGMQNELEGWYPITGQAGDET